MHTSISRALSHALILEKADIEALARIASDGYGDLSVQASCLDGSTLTSGNLNEILSYENPSVRRITSFKIEAGHSSKNGCLLVIKEDFLRRAEILVADDNDAKALKIANDFNAIFRECKPWYSALTFLSGSMFLMAMVLLSISALFWWFLLSQGRFPVGSSSSSLINAFYILLPFTIVIFIIFRYSDAAWEWLFPKIWFSIGRQQKAFFFKTKVQGIVFLGIILAAVVGLVINWVSSIFLRT